MSHDPRETEVHDHDWACDRCARPIDHEETIWVTDGKEVDGWRACDGVCRDCVRAHDHAMCPPDD